MKKTLSLMVSMALLLALLTGCGEKEDQVVPVEAEASVPVETAELPDVRTLAEAALRASGKEAALEVERLDRETDADRLAVYVEAVCGLDGEAWEDAAVIRGTGASAFEIMVLRLENEDTAAGMEAVLTGYLTDRAGAFGGYAPEEAEMAANGLVRREGRTVGLFICPETERAGDAFAAVYRGEEPPAPVEAAAEVELAPVSQGMQPLLDALAEACGKEINEIAAAGGTVSIAFPDGNDSFAETVEGVYGIAPGQWTDGFILRSLSSDVSLFELAVFRMTDQDAAQQCTDALRAYKESVSDRFCTYDSEGIRNIAEEHVENDLYVSGAHTVRSGEYAALLLCREAEQAAEVFKGTCSSLRSETPGHENPEGPPFVEIAEGVFVTEAMWPELTGDFDPDYPGRIRYVPTGNEMMEVYDTSAIVAAWQAEDPDSLSEHDRAIYDSAKTVLADILRDGMSDFEKEVEIYDWVLRNVDYDWSQTDELAETARTSYTPYGGLVQRIGVCLGYASTFQLLMELAGVECLTVVGVGLSTDDHAWNMVKLNGEWYCVDATWDWSYYSSGMMNGREWRYFNTTSDYMARTNHQWDYGAVPEATATDWGSAAIRE